MTIARGVKYGALIALFIVAYTFVGVMTYRYHERLYPGGRPNAKATWDSHLGYGHPSEVDSSPWVGIAWPIGLPVTFGLHAARLVK